LAEQNITLGLLHIFNVSLINANWISNHKLFALLKATRRTGNVMWARPGQSQVKRSVFSLKSPVNNNLEDFDSLMNEFRINLHEESGRHNRPVPVLLNVFYKDHAIN
jgi:hypothetical protein